MNRLWIFAISPLKNTPRKKLLRGPWKNSGLFRATSADTSVPALEIFFRPMNATSTHQMPQPALATFTCQMGHVCLSANVNWRAAYKSGQAIRRVDATQHQEVS